MTDLDAQRQRLKAAWQARNKLAHKLMVKGLDPMEIIRQLPKFPSEYAGLTCGAKTRKGTTCQCKAIYTNGRCKLHGGLSTGPKTEAGKEQSRINGRLGGKPKQHPNPMGG